MRKVRAFISSLFTFIGYMLIPSVILFLFGCAAVQAESIVALLCVLVVFVIFVVISYDNAKSDYFIDLNGF